MKHKLYLSLGAKGGTGKTVTVSSIADFFCKNSLEFAAYDCDLENAGKAAAFSTAHPKAKKINLRSIRDCDKLLSEAAENEISLADLPANAGGDFLQWWGELADSGTIDELGLDVVGIGAITPEAGSFAAVAQWAEVLGDKISYLISLNCRTQQRVEIQKEDLFIEYFGTKTGQLFRETFQPKEIIIPGLYEGSMIQLAKAGQLPSDAAENPNIPLLDRSRIKTWIRKIHTQIGEAL